LLIYNKIKIPHLFKCAGTSLRRTLVKYDIQGISYISEHDSKDILDNMSWCTNYNSVSLVRHPYAYYESLYNYHKDMPVINALSTITEKDYLNKIKNFDTWLDATLDLPKFFEESYRLQAFIKELSSRNGFLKSWFMNKPLNELKPDDFIGSMYSLQVNKMLWDDTQTFKLENEVPLFLRHIGFSHNLLQENITADKSSVLNKEQKERIYNADRHLFERFGYER